MLRLHVRPLLAWSRSLRAMTVAFSRPSGLLTIPSTVVIWAKETLAARAADALRPLSRGANGRRPEIAFNHSPRCLP